MVLQIPCPNCKQTIYFLGSGESESVCINCSYGYSLSEGVLEHISTRFDQRSRRRRESLGGMDRLLIYELRVSSSVGHHALDVRLPNNRAPLRAVPGDRLLMLHLSSEEMSQSLVWLRNVTTGVEHRLRIPKQELRALSGKIGCLVFLLGLILSAGLRGMPARFLQIASLPFAISVSYLSHRKQKRRLQGVGTEDRSLLAEQSLLQRLDSLEKKCDHGQSVYRSTQELILRLHKHRETLVALESQAYLSEINTLDRGATVLKEQLTLSGYLVEQYHQAISLLEVEIETGRIAEQLPDGVTLNQRLWCEMSEIDRLEDQLFALRQELSSAGIDGESFVRPR